MAEQTYFWQEKMANGQIKLGLNQAAREELGQVKYAELPQVDQELAVGDTLLAVEAQKMVQDLPTPIAGRIVATHEALTTTPELLDTDDDQENWIAIVAQD
ncbi:glycine cleavage system H family protein [Lapidilactobacillus salsurivasis]